MARVNSEYFGIFDNSDAGGNKPTASGKLIVDADLLQAIIDVAHSQTEKGSKVQVELGLGFWEKTGQNLKKTTCGEGLLFWSKMTTIKTLNNRRTLAQTKVATYRFEAKASYHRHQKSYCPAGTLFPKQGRRHPLSQRP